MIPLNVLLLIDLIIASISCIPLLFRPNNMIMIYNLCANTKSVMGIFKADVSPECDMITLVSTLFHGRNVCFLIIIYLAIRTKDHTTRRGIAIAIMLWCFYMPTMYLIHGQRFLDKAASKVTIFGLFLFGILYAIALFFDKTPKTIEESKEHLHSE